MTWSQIRVVETLFEASVVFAKRVSSNPRRGKGKRGGFRYLYVYLEIQEHIHLLFLLDKDEQEDLDQEQRGLINELVRKLKG